VALAQYWSSPTQPEDLRPFRLRGGERGLLLIHGFAGTPPEMRGLGEHLANRGFDVLGPLLAGHGLTPEDMARTRWRDWVRSAEESLERLKADCEEIFIGGQSLGGSLALHLAAHHPEVKGVVTMGAMGSPAFFSDWRLRVIRPLKYLKRWHVPEADCDLADPQALLSLHSYTRRPTVCLESLMSFLRTLEKELGHVRCPALIMHGRRDRTVPTANAGFILDRLGSADKQLVWFERSGHTITVDVERLKVYNAMAEWLSRR
jgi:carboxylesterase